MENSLLELSDVVESSQEVLSMGERVSLGLQTMLTGMAIVFGVLLLLMAILYIFKLFAAKGQKAPKAAVAPAPVATAPAVSSDDESLNVAVITAAIAAARGESDCAFNIISIKKIVK